MFATGPTGDDPTTLISRLGPRPRLLRSAVVEQLKKLFAGGLTHHPQLDAYTWNSDPTARTIEIRTKGLLSLAQTNSQARIVVDLQTVKFPEGHQRGGLVQRVGDTETRASDTPVPIIVNCIGGSEPFALIIAGEVSFRLRRNAEYLQRRYSLESFRVGGMSESKPVQNDGETHGWVSRVPLLLTARDTSTIYLPTASQDAVGLYF